MASLVSGDIVSLPVLIILAKATLVLLAALAVTRAMDRGSAVARHLVWFVALAAVLLVPVLASWGPIRLAILPPAPPAQSGLAAVPDFSGAPASAGAPGDAAASAAAPPASTPSLQLTPNVQATVNTVRGIVSPKTSWYGILSDPTVLFAIWAGVAVLFAGWLGWGAYMVSRIVRRSRTLDAQEWVTPLWEVADRLGLDEVPRLLRSEDAKMPFACGLLRPTIVLPAESDGWTLDRRRAVLLHELAHVRRRDLVGHTVGRFACALYWFHPLVWAAARRLRSESERACDDLALTCGARASDYAEHLLDIVTGVRHHATPAVALAMARRKEFEGRMLAILDPELRRTAPTRGQTIGLVATLAVLSLIVGAAVPVARAADGSVRPSGMAAVDADTSRDATTSGDREVSRAVRTVEEKQTREDTRERMREQTFQQTRQITRSRSSRGRGDDSIGGLVGSAVGAAVSVGLELSAETLRQLASGASLPNAQQGRSDDRATLLANVLRTDTSAALRRVAAWGLANFGDKDVAVDALAAALRRDADASVREMAAWALASTDGGSAAIEALANAVRRDANVKVRASAAWALGNLGDEDGVEALTAALGDTSRSVRLRAAWGLGNAGGNTAPKPLVDLLSDSESEVRQMAAWALFNIQDPDAVPALDDAMRKEKDKDTQRAFIRALAATGEKSVDAIKRLIDSDDPEVRSTAIRALAGGGASGPWPWPWPQPRPFP